MAAVWQLPMISWACNSALLSDKQLYPTLTRISNPDTFVSPVMNGMFDEFNWKQKIVIVREVSPNYIWLANAIEGDLVKSGKSVVIRTIKSTVAGSQIDENVSKSDYL